MKKQERIQDLKNEIKGLTNELKETKEILKIVVDSAIKWKNKYKEIKKHYMNLVNEKQVFVDTKPEKIVNVEIKGDVIFNPNNNFYNSDLLEGSNIFDANNEIKIQENKTDEQKKNIPFEKPILTKKEISVCKKYEEISEEESSSLMKELNSDSNDDISLQGLSNNYSSSLINLYESAETLIKRKRRRRKKY